MFYFDKYEKINFENFSFFLLLIVYTVENLISYVFKDLKFEDIFFLIDTQLIHDFVNKSQAY